MDVHAVNIPYIDAIPSNYLHNIHIDDIHICNIYIKWSFHSDLSIGLKKFNLNSKRKLIQHECDESKKVVSVQGVQYPLFSIQCLIWKIRIAIDEVQIYLWRRRLRISQTCYEKRPDIQWFLSRFLNRLYFMVSIFTIVMKINFCRCYCNGALYSIGILSMSAWLL